MSQTVQAWDLPLELPRGLQTPLSHFAQQPVPGGSEKRGWAPLSHTSIQILKFRSGEKIYDTKDSVEGVYFVKSGAVKLSSRFASPKGRLSIENFLTDILGDGEFFGYQDFFIGSQHAEEACAIKNSEIFLYPRALIEKALEQGGSLIEELTRNMAQQMQRRQDRAKYQYLASVNERICQALYELAEKFGDKTPEGIWIRLKLSRSELAQLAGTINESLSRHLGELKASGVIDVHGKDILVRRIEELKKATP